MDYFSTQLEPLTFFTEDEDGDRGLFLLDYDPCSTSKALSSLVATVFFHSEENLHSMSKLVSEVETQYSQAASLGKELPPDERKLSGSRELPAKNRVSLWNKLLATQLQGPEKLVACPSQDETVALEWELWEEGAFILVTFYHT